MPASSEPFRTQEGVNQITEQKQRGDAGNDEIHRQPSLETLTEACENPATGEKQHAHQDISQVYHGKFTSTRKFGPPETHRHRQLGQRESLWHFKRCRQSVSMGVTENSLSSRMHKEIIKTYSKFR
jgi:hypothetical protein